MDYRIGEKTHYHVHRQHVNMEAKRDINRRLFHEILSVFPSLRACADAFDVEHSHLVALINLKESALLAEQDPSLGKGVWREICEVVAHNLGFSVAELFPPDLYPFPRNADEPLFVPRVLAAGRYMSRLAIDKSDTVLTSVDRQILSQQLWNMLYRLSFRSREIIALRFGIHDGHCYTLEEVGQIFCLTRERVRQIENKALHRLREFCNAWEPHATLLRAYWIESADDEPLGPEPDESPLTL